MTGAVFAALAAGTAVAAVGVNFPLVAKWTITLEIPPTFSPAYDETHAYVALRNNHLLSISLDTGVAGWSVESTPTTAPAAGDSLVFSGGASAVQAFAASDGARRWATPIEGSAAALYWDTGWLLVTTDKNLLIAMRAADGVVLWTHQLDGALAASPAPAADRVYVATSGGSLIALSIHTGEPIWTIRMPMAANGILPVADRIFIGSRDDKFYCLAAKDGKIIWRRVTGGDVIGMPAIDTERVYFVSLDNVLRALDRNNGSTLWQTSLPIRPAAGPILAGWTLIVSGSAFELHAYSSEFHGIPLGDLVLRTPQNQEMQLAAAPHLSPAGTLVFLTKSGQMMAYVGSPSPQGP